MSTYSSRSINRVLYEKFGSNEFDKKHDERASLTSRSGKSTYLVNAQRSNNVTLLLRTQCQQYPVSANQSMLNSKHMHKFGVQL